MRLNLESLSNIASSYYGCQYSLTRTQHADEKLICNPLIKHRKLRLRLTNITKFLIKIQKWKKHAIFIQSSLQIKLFFPV